MTNTATHRRPGIRNAFGIPVIALFMVILFSVPLTAGTYVSWKGGFHVTYPDDWYQVDYNTVDLFLFKNRADTTTMKYEAAFADSAYSPFFAGDYLILTTDVIEGMTQQQVDSVLGKLQATFGANIKYYPVADLLSDLKSNEPSYGRERKVASVLNDVVMGDQLIKRGLIMMKFFDNGVASFYFYAPDSVFQDSKRKFNDIVASFSTEGLDSVSTTSNVRVADVDPGRKTTPTETDSSSTRNYLFFAVAFLLIMIVVFRRIKSRK